MNVNYKLKTKQPKQQSLNRRIKTETNENPKKISFYLSKPTKQPLQQNKRILNLTQTVQPPNNYSQIKRQKPIKSIPTKNLPPSKLVTEQYDKNHVIPLGQRNAMERLFCGNKDNSKIQDLYIKKNHLKQKQKRQDKLLERQYKFIQKDNHPFQRQTFQPKLQGQNRYAFETKVGAGTFGIVHKARDKKTLQTVAIKRVFQDKKYKNRQLQILKVLNHPNTLKMKDCFYTYEQDKQYLNVVMDYFDCNLYESIQKYRNKSQMPLTKIKIYAFQLFRSLLYLNKLSIAHRDIKPQNVLVNQKNLELVMCDFGSAKQLKVGETNIAYICSRCYRAPELIFGNSSYNTQIDMWSVGCVLVQMITMEPIFRAESNIDQLVQIIKVLGTPSYTQMLEMNPECDFQKYQLPKIGAKNWEKVIKRKNLGQEFFDLIKKVLRYSPIKRISAYEALLHPFFDQIKEQSTYMKLRKQYNIPALFDFHLTREVDSDKLKRLIPSWYLN